MANEKTTGLYNAILEVQKKVSVLKKDSKNPFFKSGYLSLAGLIEALQPVLTENDLVVMQHPLKPGVLNTKVIYAKTGEKEESTLELPIEESKMTPQGAGSAISYARRYALMALFNIATEDDDGNEASKNAQTTKTTKSYQVMPTTDAKCAKCDAPMAISNTTKKHYCSAKCWLNRVEVQQEVPLPNEPF